MTMFTSIAGEEADDLVERDEPTALYMRQIFARIVHTVIDSLGATMTRRHGDNLSPSATRDILRKLAERPIQRFLTRPNCEYEESWIALFDETFDVWRECFDPSEYNRAVHVFPPKSMTIEHLERTYQSYGSLDEGGRVRHALDRLIENPQLDPRVALAVRKVVEELRDNDRVKHTTRYEFVLYVLLLQPEQPTPISYLSKFFEGSPDPEQAVRNLLGRLNAKLKELDESNGVQVQHSSAYQLVPTK